MYATSVEDTKYRDRNLFLYQQYYWNGDVKQIFNTESINNDSVYLLVRTVDPQGKLLSPQILASSWIEDKKSDNNMSISWNKEETELSLLAIRKNESTGKAIIVYKKYSRDLKLIFSTEYTTESQFENTGILNQLEFQGNTHALVVFNNGSGSMGGIVKFNNAGFDFKPIRIMHEHSREYILHEVNGRLRFSYLSYEDKGYDKLNGYHSFDFSMKDGQKLIDNVNFGDELKEKDKDFYEFLRDDESGARMEYSFKSFIEHPDGGYIVSLHQNYIYRNGPPHAIYSQDFLIFYIDPSGNRLWLHGIPISINSVEAEHLKNFAGFDENGNYIILSQDFTKNIEYWKKGKYKKITSKDMGVSAISISPAGVLKREMIWIDEDRKKFIIPSIPNLSRINDTNKYYSWVVSKRNAELVKINMEGLDLNAASLDYLPRKMKTRDY